MGLMSKDPTRVCPLPEGPARLLRTLRAIPRAKLTLDRVSKAVPAAIDRVLQEIVDRKLDFSSPWVLVPRHLKASHSVPASWQP